MIMDCGYNSAPGREPQLFIISDLPQILKHIMSPHVTKIYKNKYAECNLRFLRSLHTQNKAQAKHRSR